jgi:hypothetical protein
MYLEVDAAGVNYADHCGKAETVEVFFNEQFGLGSTEN